MSFIPFPSIVSRLVPLSILSHPIPSPITPNPQPPNQPTNINTNPAPPRQYRYTRSENAPRSRQQRASRAHPPAILETRHDTSDAFSRTVRASDEGTYEVVAIKDRYCAFALPAAAVAAARGGGGAKEAGGRLVKEQ